MIDVAVIGGGPAGLRAAELAAAGGASVTVFDAKASVGRKFLVAGGGGLNITKDEPVDLFATRYRGPDMPPEFWRTRISEFGPAQLREWAAGLGVETFVASTKRVYPQEMKAAPLLRRWVQRLRKSGVRFAMHHRWTGWAGETLTFQTPDGVREHQARATILALGGGSWPETGSDGAWQEILLREGIDVAPLEAANCGWEVAWPAALLAEAEGRPLKNILARVGGEEARGELLVTRYGLEGGAIYQLGAALRAALAPRIEVDLKPSLDVARLVRKLGPARRNLLAEAAGRWRLDAAAVAILSHHPDRGSWTTPEALAAAVKGVPIELTGPRPLAEAISSAGGVRWAGLDETLMLRARPGVFAAGEMIDWEAPTGGFLMQGCLATGGHAALSAMRWLAR